MSAPPLGATIAQPYPYVNFSVGARHKRVKIGECVLHLKLSCPLLLESFQKGSNMLKDGSEPLDQRLDRLYEMDWRSLNYPVTNKLELTRHYSTYYPRGYTWSIDVTMDQGPDGACVGFAYAHDLIARPQPIFELNGHIIDPKYAKEELYWEAQKIDSWAGGSYPGASPFYEGTSILAGAKVLSSKGVYGSYFWALNLQQMAIGVGYDGPCIFGINWTEHMFYPDSKGFIIPKGAVVGGHAVLVYGVKIVWKSWISRLFSRKWENVDLDKSYFKIKNSWGSSWGDNGSCYISLRNAEILLNQRGDACFPMRVYG